MSILTFPLLQTAPSATGSMLTTFIPFGIVILIFYFLIIRPQNKKQKDTEKMLAAIKKGDRQRIGQLLETARRKRATLIKYKIRKKELLR